jgi:hypothetical protein
LENGEYANALKILDSLDGHNDPQNIRVQAENGLLRLEAADALQNGRYASAIRLLDYLPDFPQSDEMRSEAEKGIYQAGIAHEITHAFSHGSYDAVLAMLDANPQFADDMGFRQQALEGIMAREAAQLEEMDMLSVMITEMFQIVSLEIFTRNMAREQIIPGGFINPGTITLIWEFDSIVRFGVANPEGIIMRRDGDILYVKSPSIQIEVLESIVRNFDLVERIRSNPLVSFTQGVVNQIFEAQRVLEETMAEKIGNEQNMESAKRNFMSSFEAFCLGMGLSVVWENR